MTDCLGFVDAADADVDEDVREISSVSDLRRCSFDSATRHNSLTASLTLAMVVCVSLASNELSPFNSTWSVHRMKLERVELV